MAGTYTIQIDEVRNVAVDFRSVLDTDEEFTGTPTITTAAGLTLTNKAVTSVTKTINGEDVPSGKAITFTATGVTADDYTIEIECDTDATPAQTIIERITMTVEA